MLKSATGRQGEPRAFHQPTLPPALHNQLSQMTKGILNESHKSLGQFSQP